MSSATPHLWRNCANWLSPLILPLQVARRTLGLARTWCLVQLIPLISHTARKTCVARTFRLWSGKLLERSKLPRLEKTSQRWRKWSQSSPQNWALNLDGICIIPLSGLCRYLRPFAPIFHPKAPSFGDTFLSRVFACVPEEEAVEIGHGRRLNFRDIPARIFFFRAIYTKQKGYETGKKELWLIKRTSWSGVGDSVLAPWRRCLLFYLEYKN